MLSTLRRSLATVGSRTFGSLASRALARSAVRGFATHPSGRIDVHPIHNSEKLHEAQRPVEFSWTDSTGETKTCKAFEGEALSSALVANGGFIMGSHPKDASPQSLFCANGACSQCMVQLEDGPAKSCMVPVKEGMNVRSCDGNPDLRVHLDKAEEAEMLQTVRNSETPVIDVDVLVVGGGPAGISATIQLAQRGVSTILCDDKNKLGGKLLLQTHKFFGTKEDAYAGTRGFEIAGILDEQVREHKDAQIWLNSPAVGVYEDGVVGVHKEGEYVLVRPKRLLCAAGAREKVAMFPGNDLPGVFAAGAFQTLVNRDLVRCSDKMLVVGGGNVGLIAAYHAIQAGMEVVGLVEALPECGGYNVHEDKLMRCGVPVLTSHTVVAAHGDETGERLKSVTVAPIDENWTPQMDKATKYEVDTLLLAVGLAESDEIAVKGKLYGIPTFLAGDAGEIAEASSAMFTGKIQGLTIAKTLGAFEGDIPKEWSEKEEYLKDKGGPFMDRTTLGIDTVHATHDNTGVVPMIHCNQEIPCNACVDACTDEYIKLREHPVCGLPYFAGGDASECEACLRCVAICPGLAITLVDYTNTLADEWPVVTFPHEFEDQLKKGDKLAVWDREGAMLGEFPVDHCEVFSKGNKTKMVSVRIPPEFAEIAAGVCLPKKEAWAPPADRFDVDKISDDAIMCRCERVTAGEIRKWIKAGVRDENMLKGLTRAAMGSCGSKTCHPSIMRLFREEGVEVSDVCERTLRAPYTEVPLGAFAGLKMQ